MSRIPWLLVWFRLALAPVFPLVYFLGASRWIYVAALLAGIVCDIFDGVLARRWQCSTPPLRRFDGNTDTVFYSSAGIVAAVLQGASLAPWRWALGAMFAFMIAQNVVNIVRYGRQPSYHMYSGKLWSIALCIVLVGLYLDRPSGWAISAMIALGIYNSLEDIIASLVLPTPHTDIPTVFHAIRMARQLPQ